MNRPCTGSSANTVYEPRPCTVRNAPTLYPALGHACMHIMVKRFKMRWIENAYMHAVHVTHNTHTHLSLVLCQLPHLSEVASCFQPWIRHHSQFPECNHKSQPAVNKETSYLKLHARRCAATCTSTKSPAIAPALNSRESCVLGTYGSSMCCT